MLGEIKPKRQIRCSKLFKCVRWWMRIFCISGGTPRGGGRGGFGGRGGGRGGRGGGRGGKFRLMI